MLQSMGSQRVRHDLVTEQQAGNSVQSFPGDLKEGKACNIQLFLIRSPDRTLLVWFTMLVGSKTCLEEGIHQSNPLRERQQFLKPFKSQPHYAK